MNTINHLRYRRIGLQPDGSIIIKPLKEVTVSPSKSNNTKVALIIDVETSGLDHNVHEIIELGFIKARIDIDTGLICEIISKFSALQEPSKPIEEQITKVTGLTNEELKGKRIDWDEVDKEIQGCDFVIAHNGKFDRPFIEKKIKSLRNISWACSLKGVPWDSWGFPRHNQENLCEFHGFYYIGHRAINDVEALAELLQNKAPESDKTYFHILIESLSLVEFLIVVKNTSFDSKALFNELEFSWEGQNKIWHKLYPKIEDADLVEKRLKESLAKYKMATVEKIKIDSKNKYKDLLVLTKIPNGNNENQKILDVRSKLQLEKQFVIYADKTEYKYKDPLKKRGYLWDGTSWYMYVSAEESEIEKDWLRENVYPNNLFKGRVISNKDYIKK